MDLDIESSFVLVLQYKKVLSYQRFVLTSLSNHTYLTMADVQVEIQLALFWCPDHESIDLKVGPDH